MGRLTYDNKDSIRLEEQSWIIGYGFSTIPGIELIGGVKVELTSILLGQFDESLEAVRIGVVIIAIIGVEVSSSGRYVTFTPGVTCQTELTARSLGADTAS